MQIFLILIVSLNLFFRNCEVNNEKTEEVKKVYKRSGNKGDLGSYIVFHQNSGNTLLEFLDYCRDGSYFFYNKSNLLDYGLTDSCNTIAENIYFRMKANATINDGFLSFKVTDMDSIDYNSSPVKFYTNTNESKFDYKRKSKNFFLPIYFHGTIANDTIKLAKVYDFYGNKADDVGMYVLTNNLAFVGVR